MLDLTDIMFNLQLMKVHYERVKIILASALFFFPSSFKPNAVVKLKLTFKVLVLHVGKTETVSLKLSNSDPIVLES